MNNHIYRIIAFIFLPPTPPLSLFSPSIFLPPPCLPSINLISFLHPLEIFASIRNISYLLLPILNLDFLICIRYSELLHSTQPGFSFKFNHCNSLSLSLSLPISFFFYLCTYLFLSLPISLVLPISFSFYDTERRKHRVFCCVINAFIGFFLEVCDLQLESTLTFPRF